LCGAKRFGEIDGWSERARRWDVRRGGGLDCFVAGIDAVGSVVGEHMDVWMCVCLCVCVYKCMGVPRGGGVLRDSEGDGETMEDLQRMMRRMRVV
jgi:hypothetical protein